MNARTESVAAEEYAVGQRLPSERGLAQTIDQLHAKARLELADLETDGRLRQIEPPGRPREAALRYHFGQRAQVIRVQATHCDLQS